ncbi:hypothetical protein ASZ90_019152 [hydrocarbon metagenome]|uniref:Uncharacterized protein n=1 Tax=hydrocarbon metagenome TaxID=938273 RepID=A0A0W8E488_9ZZZZ
MEKGTAAIVMPVTASSSLKRQPAYSISISDYKNKGVSKHALGNSFF